MSVAAIMMVRDEIDVISATLDHLLSQLHRVYVLDNRSTDGTSEVLHEYRRRGHVEVIPDPVVAYQQSAKMTQLARRAMLDGYEWVVPVDADEIWIAPGTTIARFLSRQGRDVQIVEAALYDHVPTARDTDELVPQLRIGWRMPNAGQLPKVACRTHKHLEIHPGNHGAGYGRLRALAVGGLEVHHFTWRSEQQYLRKIRNGIEAYETVTRQDIGVHWRMFAGADDDQIREHFRTWFWSDDPEDDGLVFDPLALDADGAFRTRGLAAA